MSEFERKKNHSTFLFDGKECVLVTSAYTVDGAVPLKKYMSGMTIHLGLFEFDKLPKLEEAVKHNAPTWDEYDLDPTRRAAADLYDYHFPISREGGINDHISVRLGTDNPGIILAFQPTSEQGVDVLRVSFSFPFYKAWQEGKISDRYAKQIRGAIFENLQQLKQFLDYDKEKHPEINDHLVDEHGNIRIEFSMSYFKNIPREDVLSIFSLLFGDLQERGIISDLVDSRESHHPSPLVGKEADSKTPHLYFNLKWEQK